MVGVSWSDFKNFITTRVVVPQYVENEHHYHLIAIDGPFAVETRIDKSPSDTTDLDDWNTNYKPTANSSFTDSNGIPLSRTKVTRSGWHYQAHSIEITTSLLSGLSNTDITDTDLGYGSIKFYNSVGTELTLQTDIDSNCVETVIDWEPAEDVEVLGGVIFQSTTPTTDTKLWIMAAPDIPANQGGSVPFCDGGLNLKYMGTGQIFDIDGRTPKLMPYNGTYHTNKFRLRLTHTAGAQHSLLFVAKIFREAK